MHLLPDDETETEESNDQSVGSRGRRMSSGDSAAQPPAKKVKSRYGVGVPWWIAMMEYVPLYGRMVSHFPGEQFIYLCSEGRLTCYLCRPLLSLVAADATWRPRLEASLVEKERISWKRDK
jgi:hypothetical protein